jgi:uncharacterized protein (TIGR02246 family)
MGQAAIAPALQEIHRRFEAAFNAADLDGILALYEPEAVFVDGDGAVLHGQEEIRGAFAQIFQAGLRISLQTAGVVEGTGGLALMHGQWVLSGTGPDGEPVERRGVSAEVLRRQGNGSWLYALDNPFVPPAA